jgi:hypothetical protein
MSKKKTPVREIRSIVNDSGDTSYINRIMIGTPATGLVRIEWVSARYSQLIPMNWSQVQANQYMSGYYPTRYQVADAQNILVRQCLEADFEWLFLLEHDVLMPDNTLMALNEYMRTGKYPVVSGLYYSRSRPSEPLVFRGRGNSVFTDWKPGDKVWVDGVPTGCLLIHHSILRLMWDESAEYQVPRVNGGAEITRRVFETPRNLIVDLERGHHNAMSGTSDLWWCDRVMREKVIERAGWPADYCPDMRYPFLMDTSLFCGHINMSGEQFP